MSIAGNAATFLVCWAGFFTREVYLRILARRQKKFITVAADDDPPTGVESTAGGGGGQVEMTDEQRAMYDNFALSFRFGLPRSQPPSRPPSAGKRDGDAGGGGGPLTTDERALLRQLQMDRDEDRRKLKHLEALLEQLRSTQAAGHA